MNRKDYVICVVLLAAGAAWCGYAYDEYRQFAEVVHTMIGLHIFTGGQFDQIASAFVSLAAGEKVEITPEYLFGLLEQKEKAMIKSALMGAVVSGSGAYAVFRRARKDPVEGFERREPKL